MHQPLGRTPHHRGAQLSGLAIAALSILAPPLQAQIAVDDAGTRPSFATMDARDAELVATLRASLGDQADTVTAFILARLPPYMRDVDLASVVADIAGWGMAVVGCREQQPVVGFYSPLDHVWVIATAGADNALLDATLARGFAPDAETSLWWPVLWSQMPRSEGLAAAIEADAAFQAEAFAAVFPSRDCPDLDDAPGVSPRQAVTQLAELDRDAPRPDAERSALFVDDFATSRFLDLSGWRMRYLLPETGQTWIAAFTSPANPGAILFGEWTESDDGYAYHSGSLVVDLLAGLGEPS